MQGGMAGSMGGNTWSGPALELPMGLSKELTPFIISALAFPFGVTEGTAVNMPFLVMWPELSRDSLPSQWAQCPDPGHYRAPSLHSTTAHILDPHPPARAAPPCPFCLRCTQPESARLWPGRRVFPGHRVGPFQPRRSTLYPLSTSVVHRCGTAKVRPPPERPVDTRDFG